MDRGGDEDAEVEEFGAVMRFLDPAAEEAISGMLADERLELTVSLDGNGGVGSTGWVSVGDVSYRCKLVRLPFEAEALCATDPEVCWKAFDVTEALVVARAPDVRGGQSEATLEVEMLPVLHPDGLTPVTVGGREGCTRVDDAVPLAPTAAEVAGLLAEADWLERTKATPGAKVEVTPLP